MRQEANQTAISLQEEGSSTGNEREGTEASACNLGTSASRWDWRPAGGAWVGWRSASWCTPAAGTTANTAAGWAVDDAGGAAPDEGGLASTGAAGWVRSRARWRRGAWCWVGWSSTP